MPINLEMTQTPYGPMVYLPNDAFVGRSLALYGEFSPVECRFVRRLLQDGQVAVDVGANVGAVTLAMAAAGAGVLAFEAQPFLAGLARANLAMNRQDHAQVEAVALGADRREIIVPDIDYSQRGNFGGIGRAEWQGTDDLDGVKVHQQRLDDYSLPECHFIKIDVEGMEGEVLQGAQGTIGKFRPLLLVECDRPETGGGLIRQIQEMGYRTYWFVTPLWVEDNFAGTKKNVYGQTCSFDLFCVPGEKGQPGGRLKEATPEDPIATCDTSEVIVSLG